MGGIDFLLDNQLPQNPQPTYGGVYWDDVLKALFQIDSDGNKKNLTDKGGIPILQQTLHIDEAADVVVGALYNSYDAAATYAKSVTSPDYFIRWIIIAHGWITESVITLQPWIYFACQPGLANLEISTFTDDNTDNTYGAYQIFNASFGSVNPQNNIIVTSSIINDQETTTGNGSVFLYETEQYTFGTPDISSCAEWQVVEGSVANLGNFNKLTVYDGYATLLGSTGSILNLYSAASQCYLTQNQTIGAVYAYGAHIYGGGFNIDIDTIASELMNVLLYGTNIKAVNQTVRLVGCQRGIGTEAFTESGTGSIVIEGDIDALLSSASICIPGLDIDTPGTTVITGYPPFIYIDMVTAAANVAVELPSALVCDGLIISFKRTGNGADECEIKTVLSQKIDDTIENQFLGHANSSFQLQSFKGNWETWSSSNESYGGLSVGATEPVQSLTANVAAVIVGAFDEVDTGVVETPGRIAVDKANSGVTINRLETSNEIYQIFGSVDFTGNAGVAYTFEVYYNGIATGIIAKADGSGAADPVNASFPGEFITVAAAPGNVDIRVTRDGTGSANTTWKIGTSLLIKKLGS